MEEIFGKSILILGYGVEGRSAHNYLLNNYPDIKISIADKQEIKTELEVDEIFTGPDYLSVLSKYDLVIRSPGVPLTLPQIQAFVKSGKNLTTATNLFFSKCLGKIIGVTGTKGKSTTVSLIFDILKNKYSDVRLVGNIGNAALDYLEGADRQTIFVIELSSQQLEDIRYSPNIAVILNIVAEHLDHHGNFEKYIEAKSNIVKYQKDDDFVVFNPANENSALIANQSKAKKITFSAGDILNTGKISLQGPGNLENMAASACVGKLLGVAVNDVTEAIKSFKPLEHRLEFVGEIRGIRFYNDSLSTIPESLINAIEALGEDVETIIVGGFDRGLDFSSLGKFLASKPHIKNLILFPTTGEKIWGFYQGAGGNCKSFKVNSMKEAVNLAFQNTSEGKICLLSPASASFGVFKDYKDRGDQFKKEVQRLVNGE